MATITTSFNEFGQDVPNNKSNLTLTIYISADNNQTYFYNKTLSCTINGITQTASISMSKGGSVTQSFTIYDIYHNADGTKSVSWSWNVTTGTSVLGTITRSGTQTLATIPRASTISLSPSSIVLGNSSTITITRAAANFTHTLTYQIGTLTGTLATKTSSLTATFTSTKAMAEQFPNSKNGNCIITCITYSGDTQLGTSTANLTLQTEDTSEYQPTMDAMTLAFTNKFHDKVLNGISSATLTAGTTHTKYNASVSSYTLTIGSVTSRNATLTINPINRTMAANVETIQATGQVTDTRGYTGNATPISFDLYKYNAPSVTNYSLERCLQDSTPDTNGTYAKLYIKYTYANYGYSNSISVKKININDTDYTITANEQTADGITTGEGTTIIGGGNLSNIQSYDYTITITDAVGTSVIIENSLPNGAKILNFKEGGLGMAIGKPSTEDNLVDSDWDIKAPNVLIGDTNSSTLQYNGTSDITQILPELSGIFAIKQSATPQVDANYWYKIDFGAFRVYYKYRFSGQLTFGAGIWGWCTDWTNNWRQLPVGLTFDYTKMCFAGTTHASDAAIMTNVTLAHGDTAISVSWSNRHNGAVTTNIMFQGIIIDFS